MVFVVHSWIINSSLPLIIDYVSRMHSKPLINLYIYTIHSWKILARIGNETKKVGQFDCYIFVLITRQGGKLKSLSKLKHQHCIEMLEN